MKQTSKPFDKLHIGSDLAAGLRKHGISRPTELEKQLFPYALAGIDTAAELTNSDRIESIVIPALERLDPAVDKVQILIFSPMRQRVRQLASRLNKIGEDKGVKAAAIHAGTDTDKQFEALKRANIVCASPSRLLELQSQQSFEFERVKLVCLDRANKLFAGNLHGNYEKLISRITSPFNTAVFADEFTTRVHQFVAENLVEPEIFNAPGDEPKQPKRRPHQYYRIDGLGRKRAFLRVLEYEEPERGIIYVKGGSHYYGLREILHRHGYETESITEDTSLEKQNQIAADLAHDNIDFLLLRDEVRLQESFQQISHLFFFNLPETPDDYIRLINQVRGPENLTSFVTPEELGDFHRIKVDYGINFEKKPLPTKEDIREKKEGKHLDRFLNFLIEESPIPYGGKVGLAEQLLAMPAEKTRTKAVAKLFELADSVIDTTNFEADQFKQTSPDELIDETDLLDALGLTDSEEPDPDEVEIDEEVLEEQSAAEDDQEEETDEQQQKQQRQQQDEPQKPTFETEKMYINVGSHEYDSEEQLLETLCEHSGFTRDDFANVSMLDDYSFVKVKEDYFYDIINVLNRQEVNNQTLKAEKARS